MLIICIYFFIIFYTYYRYLFWYIFIHAIGGGGGAIVYVPVFVISLKIYIDEIFFQSLFLQFYFLRVRDRSRGRESCEMSVKPTFFIWATSQQMVHAVPTERLTIDCDVKCCITFSFQWLFHVYRPEFGWKTSTMFLLK